MPLPCHLDFLAIASIGRLQFRPPCGFGLCNLFINSEFVLFIFCQSNPSTAFPTGRQRLGNASLKSSRTISFYVHFWLDPKTNQKTQVLPHNLNKILRYPHPQMKRTRSHCHGNSNSFSSLGLSANLIFKGYGDRTLNKIHVCVHFFACPTLKTKPLMSH